MTVGGFPAYGSFADNGLAEPAAGGVVVRAGTENGLVRVGVRVLAEPFATVEIVGWEEVVDLSWHAERGSAGVSGHRGRVTTPPWPGDYRVRVHAYGRDDPETENHDLWIWTAPPEPPRVHARADRLGHRLRGEPEPPVVARPEAAHRWIGRSRLAVAATVTVATRPVRRGGHPWSRSRKRLLRLPRARADAASRAGRAASMFWNVNAVTRLSFARAGEVLASFEPGLSEPSADEEVVAALAGLDWRNHRDRTEKGLAAVERFTGRGLSAEDPAEFDRRGVAYRISDRG